MWGLLHFLIVPNDAVSRKRKREKEGEKRKRLIPKWTEALNRADIQTEQKEISKQQVSKNGDDDDEILFQRFLYGVNLPVRFPL